MKIYKLLTAVLTVLLMSCDALDPMTESDLYGCWRISASLISSYLSFDSDHTYQMMLSEPDRLYDNNGTPEARREYSEGTWHLEGTTIKMLCGDSLVCVLPNTEIDKGLLYFDMKWGEKNWRYGGERISEILLSDIIGTWSFSEREVFHGLKDMVMTLDDTYHARMTFLGTEDGRSYKMYDWTEIDYTILGNYIVFTGLNPTHYFYRYTAKDGNIEYLSGNSNGTITSFRAKPQAPEAHTLRLDGIIF